MMLFFTIATLACVYFLQFTEFIITWTDIKEGLSFRFPPAMVVIAVAAFGITGVGGDEIMYYNYWCIEKGYAAFTGPGKIQLNGKKEHGVGLRSCIMMHLWQ